MATGGPLGCCVNTASIWDKCLQVKVADLRDASCLEYERALDDLSEASVTVGRGCCDVLDRIHRGETSRRYLQEASARP